MDVEQVMANAQAEATERSTPASAHPTEAQLWVYLHGDLDGDRRRRIGAHLGNCPDCRAELTSLRDALAEVEILLPKHLETPSAARETATVRHEGWLQRMEHVLQPAFGPRRWAWHAVAFVAGSTALVGLNSYLHATFMPEPSPFGSPPSPPWWTQWWVLYAIGAWAGLLALHGLLVWWQQRDDGRSNTEKSDQN